MKLKILLMTAFIFGLTYGQALDVTFTEEGVQAMIDNSALLTEEPIVNILDGYEPVDLKLKNGILSPVQSNSEFSLKAGAETQIGGNMKTLIIPLVFGWKNYNIGASIPVIMSKSISLSIDEITPSGIGDATLNIGYSNIFKGFYYSSDIFLKFSTGDWDNFEASNFAPLGTGSTDYVFSASVLKPFENISLSGSVSYKLNMSSDVKVIVYHPEDLDSNMVTQDTETVEFSITNGNLLLVNMNCSYYYKYNLKFSGRTTFLMTGEGETDKKYSYSYDPPKNTRISGISNNQDMMLLDITPSVSFSYNIIELTSGIKIPVYTEINEEMKKIERGLRFFLKVNYNIF